MSGILVNMYQGLATLLVYTSSENNDFIDRIIPKNIESFIVPLCAFLVLVIAATFLFYKPVKKVLNERAAYVENHIKSAEAADETAKEKLALAEEEVTHKKKEAYQIMVGAKQDGEKEKERIIQSAKEEAQELIHKAELDIAQSRQKALDDVHDEMVEVAIEASKAILQREVDKDDHQRLVQQFIKDVEK